MELFSLRKKLGCSCFIIALLLSQQLSNIDAAFFVAEPTTKARTLSSISPQHTTTTTTRTARTATRDINNRCIGRNNVQLLSKPWIQKGSNGLLLLSSSWGKDTKNIRSLRMVAAADRDEDKQRADASSTTSSTTMDIDFMATFFVNRLGRILMKRMIREMSERHTSQEDDHQSAAAQNEVEDVSDSPASTETSVQETPKEANVQDSEAIIVADEQDITAADEQDITATDEQEDTMIADPNISVVEDKEITTKEQALDLEQPDELVTDKLEESVEEAKTTTEEEPVAETSDQDQQLVQSAETPMDREDMQAELAAPETEEDIEPKAAAVAPMEEKASPPDDDTEEEPSIDLSTTKDGKEEVVMEAVEETKPLVSMNNFVTTIPDIPIEISLNFGKPLEVIQERIPPLQTASLKSS